MEHFDHLTQDLQKFIEQQKVFFVGTATSEGLINVSPKGYDSLKIIDKNRILLKAFWKKPTFIRETIDKYQCTEC